MPSSTDPLVITVGTRGSPLALIQVDEVLDEIQQFHPEVQFQIVVVETAGDLDQTTSLREIKEKSDFFTREIDAMQAHGSCRLSIHSAKDLPDPLHPELEIIALTKGVDSSDSLVLPDGESLETLPEGAQIATSSERREEAVRELRSDLSFVDIRGSVEKRIAEMEYGRVDGLVVAEAAIIRLGLTGLNRITLPGPTVEGQGQLAVIARKDDDEMRQLFASIDCRQLS